MKSIKWDKRPKSNHRKHTVIYGRFRDHQMSNDKRPEWVPSDLNPKRILTDDNGRILRRAFYGGFWDEPKGTNLEVYADASQAGMDRHPEIEKRLDMDELRPLLPVWVRNISYGPNQLPLTMLKILLSGSATNSPHTGW